MHLSIHKESSLMDSLLKGLFGGDDNNDDRRNQANDFISRYEQGPIDQGYDEQEAYNNFQQVSQYADPATMQRAAEQAFSRMDPDQRAQLAQMIQQQGGGQFSGRMSSDPRDMAGMVSQMQGQNPNGLASLFSGGNGGSSDGDGLGGALGGLLGGSGGGFPGGTLGKVALGGIAAYAMKEMIGGGGDDDKGRKRSV
jgi:hypothetical protein